MNRFMILLGILGALVISWYSASLQATEYGPMNYKAKCFVDPDNFFGHNEIEVAELEGSLDFMISECNVLAKMRYRNNYSLSLKEITPNARIYSRELTGKCHIDYDAMIDFDKNVIGILVGESVESLYKQCAKMLRITYGNGSLGVNQINKDRELNYPVSAECWVDDDAMYDPGHLLLGRLYGNSLKELDRDCRLAASRIYRYPFSAGLENIQRHLK
jgi:hypothetical protein